MTGEINDIGPMSGIKVVEIGVAMAGPFCGMMLADYGADVVKVERVESGDDSRGWPPFFPEGDVSHYFAAANRNKKSLAIDLKAEEGAEIVRKLAAEADVVIDNFRVGVLDRLGLGYEVLSKVNPRLIYCAISGFGASGPKSGDGANDIFMQAYSGNMSITGEAGGGPAKSGISVADIGAGLFGTIGVLMALHTRARTGRGQRVDTSLLEGQLAMLSYHVTSYFATGKPGVRRGASSQLAVPYQAFKAKDDYVIVAAFNERMWHSVCEVIGRPDLADDERFRIAKLRGQNRTALIPILAEIFETRTVAEWVEDLTKAGVPCSPINSVDKVVADPQVLARDMVVSVAHPKAGVLRMAGLPIKFSETPGRIVSPPPLLGGQTEAVLAEIGLTREQIEKLREKGIVGVSE